METEDHNAVISTADTVRIIEGVDWQGWMKSWDRQQTGYIPRREERFAVIGDVLAELLPADFLLLDLACGPGSISQRMLARFPQARSIAVDLDPVLMAIGRNVLGDVGGRLTWQEADLRDTNWPNLLPAKQFHAVLSTTALHWLPVTDLLTLYRQLGELIIPGGVFLNGDQMKFGPQLPAFQRVAEGFRIRARTPEAFATQGAMTWEQWWEALKAEPTLQALFAEREQRFSWRSPTNWVNPIYDLQASALREAGFREVGSIWQSLDNHVLMAVK